MSPDRMVAAALALLVVVASPAAAVASEPDIRAEDALADVRYLASPALEGRGALTRGLDEAAGYVERRFAAARLAPGGDGGTFFQAVDIPLAHRPAPGTRLVLGGAALAPGDDFSPNPGSAASRVVGQVVFAGYGVVVPGRYDDFAGLDVRGKVVICLRYAPGFDARDSRAGAADPALRGTAALQNKLDNAVARGAAALIIVDAPRPGADGADAADGAAPLPFFGPRGASNIASFHVRAAAVDRALLAAAGKTVAGLRAEIEARGRPVSFELPAWADLAVAWTRSKAAGRNVVAVLEGSDPALAGEAVLIGAHYDHLGRGDEGSALDGRAVHPGADDNASGTAALLEIAEALGAGTPRPRRSIVLAAFTGEEKGLLGSAVAAAHARKKIVAMVNLDMVGRMRGGAVEVGGAPTAPDWRQIVEAANAERLVLTFPPRVVPNSDHASFVAREVPSLFLFTGMHGDYHRASDTWDKVNADGVAKVARLAARVARAVADRQDRLAFVAPQWTRSGALGAAHGTGVRLGIMPDYQWSGGLRVTAVAAGGAAAAAGIQAGDVIERVGEKAVGDIETYMDALAAFKPGDQALVRVRGQAGPRDLIVRFPAAAAPVDDGGAASDEERR